jgi:hypothetical protein
MAGSVRAIHMWHLAIPRIDSRSASNVSSCHSSYSLWQWRIYLWQWRICCNAPGASDEVFAIHCDHCC